MAQQHRKAQYTPLRDTPLPARYAGEPTSAGAGAVVLLHGFTQTGGSWEPLLPHLRGTVVLPDLPGHGTAGPAGADLWATADRLSALVHAPATWVGYSMGGRAALHVALSHPEVVAALVLISATPGLRDESERQLRRASDEKLACRLESEGIEGFLGWWLAQPLFSTLPADRADRRGRLANTAAGLAASLRLAGTGSQQPLWDRLGELGRRYLPVLCIAGELDPKYVAIAHDMVAAIGPSATELLVPGAGHACHLERPEVVGTAVARFVSASS